MVAKPKLFRDPVHDTIALSRTDPAGRLALALADTREMQRLRRIRQLGLSYLVYPGAEHSRFAHSLGVLWLAWQVSERVAQKVSVSDDDHILAVAAALLHDVGHGPFSHALEAVTGVDHEDWTHAIILDPETEVHRVLTAMDPSLPTRVSAVLAKRGDAAPWVSDLVSSQLDADRLDYILRDGHATGVRIGSYDLARILALLDVVDGHLAVHAGAQEAVEGYLLARFHMYKQVYLHKTSRSAERMLEAALTRAAHLRRGGHAFDYWPPGALGDLIVAESGKRIATGAFARIDDTHVWVALSAWADGRDKVLADLSRGLCERRLWKPVVLPANDPGRAHELVSAARSVARVKGFDPDYAVLVDECEDPLYKPFTGVGDRRRSIRIVEPGGGTSFIEDRSEVVKMLGQLTLRQRLLCVHPELKPAVERQLAKR
ncbi:MAG: HD domain-containing protein [Deltaproteobacteria bacterium]|nr:MAG: HD domain-containing protein [Deltaproteobacteria bacterium]